MIEFGCGYGTFTLAAAARVRGRVYALDIEPALVAETAEKAERHGLTNVTTDARDILAGGCGRPDSSAGYVMLFNILHVEEPLTLLREAFRVLVPGGTVGVIHWRTDLHTPRGPHPVIRPSLDGCRRWAEEAGFVFEREEPLCCCSWHWGLVMRKPDQSP